MPTQLVTFGDSWTFGSELDLPREKTWSTLIGQARGWTVTNLSCPASSIGHLAVQLFQYIDQADQWQDYQKIFMIGLTGTTRYLSYSNLLREFINITPEAVYRSGAIHESGRPPDVITEFRTLSHETYKLVECQEYNQFIMRQTVMLFDNYCELNSIDRIFFSYFDYVSAPSRYFYPESITRTLTGQEYHLPDTRSNQYFQGKLFHPNQLGHQRIAEILMDFYDQNYSGN